MTRSEPYARVAAATSLSKADAAAAAGAIFFPITGFGKFTTRDRPARTGHNSQTGEAVAIAARRVPAFKAGKALCDAVNA